LPIVEDNEAFMDEIYGTSGLMNVDLKTITDEVNRIFQVIAKSYTANLEKNLDETMTLSLESLQPKLNLNRFFYVDLLNMESEKIYSPEFQTLIEKNWEAIRDFAKAIDIISLPLLKPLKFDEQDEDDYEIFLEEGKDDSGLRDQAPSQNEGTLKELGEHLESHLLVDDDETEDFYVTSWKETKNFAYKDTTESILPETPEKAAVDPSKTAILSEFLSSSCSKLNRIHHSTKFEHQRPNQFFEMKSKRIRQPKESVILSFDDFSVLCRIHFAHLRTHNVRMTDVETLVSHMGGSVLPTTGSIDRVFLPVYDSRMATWHRQHGGRTLGHRVSKGVRRVFRHYSISPLDFIPQN
jgi:hypothetical protein